jgi:hypothetical protein
MYRKKPIKPETFVTAWQTSDSVDEFCERTGMKKNSAVVRACSYRKKGINLKKMPRKGGGRNPLNVKLLNQLISASTEEVIEEQESPAVFSWPKIPPC